MTNKKILIVNGVQLDQTTPDGDRPSLEQIRKTCVESCRLSGVDIDFRQSNDAEEIVRWIIEDHQGLGGLLFNPGCTPNVAEADMERYSTALESGGCQDLPIVEVRLDNPFRSTPNRTRLLSRATGDIGFVSGIGAAGYAVGIEALAKRLGAEAG